MPFTKTDSTLMHRAARHLSEAAALEKNSYGNNWAASSGSREAKRRYDRLLRDERDLRELARRMGLECPAVLVAVVPTNGDENGQGARTTD